MSTEQIVSLILSIISFALILLIGIKTDALRAGVGDRPYSFHKFQIWLWTLVICPCFALNWGFVNPTEPTLNKTALILLGISLGAALTGEVITSVQKNDPNRPISFKAINGTCTGFFSDILKDDYGQVSVARLQQLIFTLMYVAVYITMFFPSMIYPEFADYAFVLMGISSGSFLIGKGLYK